MMIFLPDIKWNWKCFLFGHVFDYEIAYNIGWTQCVNCKVDEYEYYSSFCPSLKLWEVWWWLHGLRLPVRWPWRCPWCNHIKWPGHDCVPF